MNRAARRTETSKSRKAKPLKLVEAAPPAALKLDLGCGLTPKEGFEGVDVRGDKKKYAVDLFKFPWPFEDNSVEEIHCSHLVEHIPAREVEERDIVAFATAKPDTIKRFLGQDMLFAFMDECWRILQPDAWIQIVVPSARSNRAFQDPTHRRFLMQETFMYLDESWRELQSLQHYIVRCNFKCDIGHSMPQEEGTRSTEAQQMRAFHYWNTTIDWIVKCKKLPRMTAEQIAEVDKVRQAQIAQMQAQLRGQSQ